MYLVATSSNAFSMGDSFRRYGRHSTLVGRQRRNTQRLVHRRSIGDDQFFHCFDELFLICLF